MRVAIQPVNASLRADRVVSCRGAAGLSIDHPVLARPRSLYDGFEAWWMKVCTEDRTCFVLEDLKGGIRGIAVIDPRGSGQVKLCTFCLVDGERSTGMEFLQSVCSSLALSGSTSVYGTVLPEQTAVLAFFERAGFQVTGQYLITKQLA